LFGSKTREQHGAIPIRARAPPIDNMNDVPRPFRPAQKTPAVAHAVRHCCGWAVLLASAPAQAALFQGDQLDAVADIVAWVALIIGPLVAIVVFWLVHILPEKIAEKRKHPQAKAIKTLCLLSLFFGGLLWPIAWLWATTKPVLHKMAYGTDVEEHGNDVAVEDGATLSDDAEHHRLRQIKVIDREEELPPQSVTNRERA
jgi:CBS domain containing-hemolysin-like protein